jgi:cytochrome o ubiquinol oxidase subunit 2
MARLRVAGFLVAAVASFACSACEASVLQPQGPIGAAEKSILIDSIAIMLAIVLPTIAAILGFAWWYRASNTKARYLPEWAYSGQIELVVWAVPALVVMLLSGVAWIGSHQLDPARPIASQRTPLEVQVVSLDWKWLFIYPGQKIAAVNTLTLPLGTPVHFSLTSASVMSAFFIPQLGSMIYTMNGMTTRLNLQADTVSTLHGLSAHFNGDGFSDMNFEVHAVSEGDFSSWVQSAGKSDTVLDDHSYAELMKQTIAAPPALFRLGDPDLFQSIATQKLPPGPGPQTGATDVR